MHKEISYTAVFTVENQNGCLLKLCKCDYEFGLCAAKYKRLYKHQCVGVRSKTPCK